MRIRDLILTTALSAALAVSPMSPCLSLYAAETDPWGDPAVETGTDSDLDEEDEDDGEEWDEDEDEFMEDEDYDEEDEDDGEEWDEDEDEDLEDSDEEGYDWDLLSEFMTVEDTKLRLGFSRVRNEYTVVVNVASQGQDEECGSDEKFCFQLIFDEGSSAAVLANSQLPTGGFGSGRQESFTIKTNRDYGDLVSVRIIPLASDPENFDKLRIDSITVYETDESGITEQWLIDDVGWIGSREKEVSSGTPRTVYDISEEFEFTRNATAVNLLLCIATVEGGKDEIIPQFEGTVKAQIDYKTADGTYRSKIFDLVDAIDEYNTADNGYEAVISDRVYDGRSLKVSDPGRMFRANHMDRCVVSLEDMVSVSDIILTCGSPASTVLGIESICASVIRSPGKKSLNPNDELVRSSETTPLCMSSLSGSTPAYSFDLTSGSVTTLTIPFSKNEIKEDEEGEGYEIVSTDSDERLSDVMNLYVFPSDAGQADDASRGVLKAAIQYTDVYGDAHQVSADPGRMNMGADAEDNEFYYANALGCADMAVINKLVLAAEGGSLGFPVDHAVIQRVRGSMVTDTWYFEVGEDISGGETYLVPSNAYGHLEEISAQNLTAQFAEDTKRIRLARGKKDIGFLIRYRQSVTDYEVRSAIVYLTDMGITEIGPGSIVSLPFKEKYVSEILGISAIPIGKVDAAIEAAYATNLVTDDETVDTGYYSFADGLYIERGVEASADRTSDSREGAGSVLPLEMTFSTSEYSRISGGGELGGVSLTIGYKDLAYDEKVYFMDDMDHYIISGDPGRTPGSSLKIKVLLTDVYDISYVTVSPLAYSWNIAGIGFDLGEGLIIRQRMVDKVASFFGDETILLNVSYEELEEEERAKEEKKEDNAGSGQGSDGQSSGGQSSGGQSQGGQSTGAQTTSGSSVSDGGKKEETTTGGAVSSDEKKDTPEAPSSESSDEKKDTPEVPASENGGDIKDEPETGSQDNSSDKKENTESGASEGSVNP